MKYSALIGKPVEHSFSPILFSILAREAGIEYAHIKIEVSDENKLKPYLQGMADVGFVGVNVTLPYKLAVMPFVDELSKEVKIMGAVNTIVFQKDGKKVAYNTDGIGALRSIESKLKQVDEDDKVLVIGAGGAARAIVFELCQKSKSILILNRDEAEAKSLASDLDKVAKGKIFTAELNEQNIIKAINDCVFCINATPVGMYPEGEEEIVSAKLLEKIGSLERKYFFDAIFNPYETKFLINARENGAKVCPGIYMMIFQALKAFELWTGENVDSLDADVIAQEIKNKL